MIPTLPACLTEKSIHLRFLALCFFWIALASCGEAGYYFQAMKGQTSLMMNRKPIDRLLNSPDSSESLKERLRLVQRIKQFAIKELQLPENNNFTSLVSVPDKHVIWNVYAAPALSVVPEKWCFPFAGCVSYRGYFTRKGAESYSKKYRDKGFDVYIGGSAAFSTLGWFDDPVFSTFLDWPEASLSGLIFHELAHGKVYVKNDSSFNESFAMTVENEGVKRWFEKKGKTGRFEKFLEGRMHREEFSKLMLNTREKLKQVYLSDASDTEKKVSKGRIIKNAQNEYAKLQTKWGNDKRWDSWVHQDLNNAKLASVATYSSWVPAFTNILKEKKSFAEFYRIVKDLAKMPKEKRNEALRSNMGQPH